MAFLREMRRKDRDGKFYSYWVVVKTYREKRTKKVKHKILQSLGRLSGKEVRDLRLLWQMKELGEDVIVTKWEKIKVGDSYDFLTMLVCDYLYKMWELDKVLKNDKSLTEQVWKIAEILVINRVIFPNSDYKVSSWYKTTFLDKLLKVKASVVNPSRIYRTLDTIYEKTLQIQQHLADRIISLGFDDFSLVLYDITSSYFENNRCPIVKFGLSREKRKDKPQVLLALCVTKEGFPFYWEVLPGDIHDSTTVKGTISDVKEKFNIEKVCLVMDKGMVNEMNLKEIERSGFYYIVTIGSNIFRNLSSFPGDILSDISKEIEKEGKKEFPDYQNVMKKFPCFSFHSKRAYFYLLEGNENYRYILCFNPEKFIEERKQREEKISSIERYFTQYNKELLKARKTRNKKTIEYQLYSYLKKRQSLNLFTIHLVPHRIKKNKTSIITTYQIRYKINLKKLNLLKMTDGTYCIKTNLPQQHNEYFIVSSYRQRRKVESSFHYLKGFVEIRPFYHQKEERIKGHITVCILAYLIQITTEYLLKKAGINISFQEFISKIQQKRAVDLEIENIRKKDVKLPVLSQNIKKLLSAIGINNENGLFEK
mgnify:CR=1 FL=1